MPSPVTTTNIDGQPYLCASHEAERRVAQPIRAVTALVGGPLVVYASTQVKGTALRASMLLTGTAMTAWSAWLWYKANQELR
jgi:hypothetical protein